MKATCRMAKAIVPFLGQPKTSSLTTSSQSPSQIPARSRHQSSKAGLPLLSTKSLQKMSKHISDMFPRKCIDVIATVLLRPSRLWSVTTNKGRQKSRSAQFGSRIQLALLAYSLWSCHNKRFVVSIVFCCWLFMPCLYMFIPSSYLQTTLWNTTSPHRV